MNTQNDNYLFIGMRVKDRGIPVEYIPDQYVFLRGRAAVYAHIVKYPKFELYIVEKCDTDLWITFFNKQKEEILEYEERKELERLKSKYENKQP